MSETFVGALNRHMQDEVLDKIKPKIRNYGSILDLGCGDGILMRRITEMNPIIRTVGVNASDELIKIARKHSFGFMTFHL